MEPDCVPFDEATPEPVGDVLDTMRVPADECMSLI